MSDVSENFAFLVKEFPKEADSATLAERHARTDPRGSLFHCRHSLELVVGRLYRLDRSLTRPQTNSLGELVHEPCFRSLLPDAVWQKVDLIREAGNRAVHGRKEPTPETAQHVVEELYHILYWVGRNYLRKGAEDLKGHRYNPELAKASDAVSATSQKELQTLETKLAEQTEAAQEREKELTAELAALQKEIAEIKAENAGVEDTHDYDEAGTRAYLIDEDLRRAGWDPKAPKVEEYEVTGMPNAKGVGYADYVLWGDDDKPLAVIEAKRTTVDPEKGQQQAKLYADCLEQMTGQRPLIFYTNGYRTSIWDDTFYPPRQVQGFYKKEDLQRIIQRRDTRKELDVAEVDADIAGRYYQKRAIGSLCKAFAEHRRKGLLVMATGTGKTRTAIALVDLLQRANWAKRVLFLADRISLVNQAANAFKAHLPDSSPVNLITEKNKEGRVYISTYPTMMGLINDSKTGEARFSPGYFDLVIIDEAHRSVYQKYRTIFRYFDSLLVGLTATPRDQVDKNTYGLFDLDAGVPSDAYELDTAVRDGFLVPPKVEQVDLKFPREGIHYDDLSEEEQAEWESLDWGDSAGEDGKVPKDVSAAAVNQWLFNKDTVDKVLQVLMERGHKVEAGDRLGKTIIFARNHDHAKFIEERFNHHYPEHAGHFARVIDNYANYPQSLIDDFSIKDKAPHLAISVDMLDTGIDVPEVLNLVFFKPIYSKVKFWQAIGRGTRLCPDLFSPGEDKEDFRIFDFCFNFDFFRENPEGIESGGGEALATRLFRARVGLLSELRANAELEPEGKLDPALTQQLHGEVAAMNKKNFIVRMELEAVEKFQNPEAWQSLSSSDVHALVEKVATLPSEIETDEIEARLFDLTSLKLQMALVEQNTGAFETLRARVIEMAAQLEEKTAIPAVKAQLAYLQAVQTTEFWEGITLGLLEELRERLRGLMQFLDKKKRKIVYTDFKDEVKNIKVLDEFDTPTMTSVQYQKKVEAFIKDHLDHIVVQKLRQAEALTHVDLDELERMLTEIGEDEGDKLLKGLLAQSEAPSLVHFVRSLVGLDREAVQGAFAQFLEDRSLTPQQIRFIELVIEQLTARGVMDASALYAAPFVGLHSGGPEALFEGKDNVVDGIFEALKGFQPDVGKTG